jgi:uncharacterized membrane protein
MHQKDLLNSLDKTAVVRAIEAAETACSGEIRVHIEPNCHGKDVRFLAERTFERLGMTKTALRNGVLIFLAANEQQFAVIGDSGIHEKVGPAFWEDVAGHMTEAFRKGSFTQGVVDAVQQIGASLACHYPFAGKTDVNELSNEVTTGSSPEPPAGTGP